MPIEWEMNVKNTGWGSAHEPLRIRVEDMTSSSYRSVNEVSLEAYPI